MNKKLIIIILFCLFPNIIYAQLGYDLSLYASDFKQTLGGWQSNNMNDIEKMSIYHYGCLITSMTNLLHTYGLRWIPDSSHRPDSQQLLNPGTFDDWLTTYNGYKKDTVEPWRSAIKGFYYANWPAYNRYYWVAPNDSCYPIASGHDSGCFAIDWSKAKAKAFINSDLTMGIPPIVKIKYNQERYNNAKKRWELKKSDSHFVLITGYSVSTNSYLANDPGKERPSNTPLANLYPPLVHFDVPEFGNNPAYKILEIRRYVGVYTRELPNLAHIGATVRSPVEIQLVDQKGSTTGYDSNSGTVFTENPRGLYYESQITALESEDLPTEHLKTLEIDEPTSGNYILKIIGTGDGPYTIDVETTKEDGTVSFETTLTGTATAGANLGTYRIKYSPTEATTMSTDNQMPVAEAGSDQKVILSSDLVVNLSSDGSSDPDGDPLQYKWSVLSKPNNSNPGFTSVTGANVGFVPDLPGLYTLQLIANDHFTDSTPDTVTITVMPADSIIAVTPDFSSASSSIVFDVKNNGTVTISSGKLDVVLKDIEGAVIYSGSQAFSIGVGQNTSLSFPVTLPPLKFGNYVLEYTQSDETKTGIPAAIQLPNAVTAVLSLDKASYKVRESAILTVKLTNSGKFSLDGAVMNLSIPDLGYTGGETISLIAGQTQTYTYGIPVPETVSAGQHGVNATIALPAGSSLVSNTKLAVRESALVIDYTGPTNLNAGDSINLTIENTGGVDTSYATEKLVIIDNKNRTIYQSNVSGSLLAGEKKSLSNIQLPPQIASGQTYLVAKINDLKSGKSAYFDKPLSITGVSGTLQTRTDKDVYLTTESITAITNIANAQSDIENGALKIAVSKTNIVGTDHFAHFMPKTGWWPFYDPYAIAVASDGSVYVADTSNNRVVKFDQDGNFIAKWGSYGTGDGQFSGVGGIAVAPDSSIYVTDLNNNRIQKFDSNGNFVMKWGAYGTGDGKFNNPWGIVVANGAVYISDFYNHRIQKFDCDGNFITKWGSRGSGNGQFTYPGAIAVASDETIYVADTYNNRIQKFDSNGNFITKWGSYGNGNGYFYYPRGIDIGPDGMIYVADTSNQRIQKFSNNGSFIKQWSNNFNYPTEVAVAVDGSVYVVENGSRVQKFDNNGNYICQWGTNGANNGSFYLPGDISIGTNKFIYVADTGNNRIQKFDNEGNYLTQWGSYGSGNGQFYTPYGVAVAMDGSVYVADTYNNRIQKFDGNGNFITKWGSYGSGNGQFNTPWRVAVSPDGYVYVTDSTNNRIQKFDTNGNFVTKWGTSGSGTGQLYLPRGIDIGSDGSVYVAEVGNNRIQKFDSNGNYITMWGGSYGSEDWQMASPYDVASSPDGFIYVVTMGDSRVKKYTNTGNFVAKWGTEGSNDEQFFHPRGLSVDSNNSVYVVDTGESWKGNHRIQKMIPKKISKEVLFETLIPVNQYGNSSQDYLTNIGMLNNVTGKLYLDATLSNSFSQVISLSEHPFYIVDGNIVLSFSSNKKTYKQGEAVVITGEVKNISNISVSGLNLKLFANDQNIYSATLNLSAESSYPFTITTSAGTTGNISLTGEIKQNNNLIAKVDSTYIVAKPEITISISSPDSVGKESFVLGTNVSNSGMMDSSVSYTLYDNYWNIIDRQQLVLRAGEIKLFRYNQQITQTSTYRIYLSGDVSASASKSVVYGEAATVTFGGSSTYPEGSVGTPITITNTGQIDETLTITYQMQGAAGVQETRTYFIPKGGTINDIFYCNLLKGSYVFKATSMQPSISVSKSISVQKEDDVAMNVTAGSQNASGLIPVTVRLFNYGYNAMNGGIKLSVLDSLNRIVWAGSVQVAGLATQTYKDYIINITSADVSFGPHNTNVVLYNNSGKQITSKTVQITVLGPSFKVTSAPANPSITVGTNTTFSFAVKNTGTLAGEMMFAVKTLEGVLDSSIKESLMPGEEKQYAFNLQIPETTIEGDYSVDYKLNGTGIGSQITSETGQASYRIAGINVAVDASLDKQTYRKGDTATLTMTVSKLSQFEDGTYLAIIRYGDYHDLQTFTLSGQPATVTFQLPLQITGEMLFYGVYFQSGGRIYQKSLVINQTAPDLTVSMTQNSGIGTDNKIPFSFTAANYGQTTSAASVVTLYDGNPASGGVAVTSFNIPQLESGTSYSMSYSWNVIGKAGEHKLYAIIDPDNAIAEFNESNNISAVAITVPDVVIHTSMTKESYKANEDIPIILNIVNMTSNNTFTGHTLKVELTDAQGAVHTVNEAILSPLLPSSEVIKAIGWNTASTVPGVSTIRINIYGTAGIVGSGSASLTIESTPSMTGSVALSKSEVIQGFPLSIDYTLKNNGNIDLSGGDVEASIVEKASGVEKTKFSQTFAGTHVLEAITGRFDIDKLMLDPADYRVKITAQTAGLAFSIGEAALKVLPPLEVSKGIATVQRVLVLADSPDEYSANADKNAAISSETAIKQALNNMGVYFKIVKEATIFRDEMRTGLYNSYIISGNKPLTDHLDEELTERVNSGDGILFLNYGNITDSKMQELVGVVFNGYLADQSRTVTFFDSPISGQGTLPVSGKIQKLEASSKGTVSVAVVEDKGVNYPAVLLHNQGAGKVVLASCGIDPSSIGNALKYIAPARWEITPHVPVPVEIALKSFGASFELKVEEDIDAGLKILLADAEGVIDQNKISWTLKLSSNETKKLSYFISVPDETGNYNTTSKVFYNKDGSYEFYNSYALSIDLTASLVSMKAAIGSALKNLTVDSKDTTALAKISGDYENVIESSAVGRQSIDTVIKGLLQVIADLKRLSTDTGAIRMDIDRLIRAYERQWADGAQ